MIDYNTVIQKNLNLLRRYGYIPEELKSEVEFDELESEIENQIYLDEEDTA